MRIPHEMRLVGLTRQEYQIIGKIAVLSGMLEQQMKEMVVKLVRAPWPDGLAICAHMNFRSLCDTSLALIPSTVPANTGDKFSLQQSFRSSINAADKAYDGRNKLLHGPFSPWAAIVGSKKSTFKTTARGKIQHSGLTFDKEALTELLGDLIDAHSSISGCVLLLEIECGESNPFPRSFPPHTPDRKAIRRKSTWPRKPTRG